MSKIFNISGDCKAELLDLEDVMPEEIRSRLDAFLHGDLCLLQNLFRVLSRWCRISERKIVLMIDEVDSATNNQVFLDFLAQLRGYYLDRDERPAFHSVILAGVYDVKNIKRKIRSEEDHKANSPWNTRENNEESGSLLPFDECTRDHKELAPYDIAAPFNVDMSFSKDDSIGNVVPGSCPVGKSYCYLLTEFRKAINRISREFWIMAR